MTKVDILMKTEMRRWISRCFQISRIYSVYDFLLLLEEFSELVRDPFNFVSVKYVLFNSFFAQLCQKPAVDTLQDSIFF